MPVVGAITLYVSLLTFTLHVHPDRLDYVDQRLDYVDQVLLDEECFKENQKSVARLIPMLYNDDTQEMLKIICTVKKHILLGGPKFLPFTVPPLVFSSLELICRLQSWDEELAGEEVLATPTKIYQILHQIIGALSSVPCPELSLRSYLQCAKGANDCGLEPVAYDCFTQAFVLYEEKITDSKAQVTAIHFIIETLQKMNIFRDENRDTLTNKATGYSRNLLKKPDQCRAVCECSHLFWVDDQDGIKDGNRSRLYSLMRILLILLA